MKNFIALALLVLTSTSHAAISRGGFGLLFPDTNSLRNPGESARSTGVAVEGFWAKFTGSHEQAFTASVAATSGKFALLAMASRYGMDPLLTSASQDIAGVGIGFAPSDISFGVMASKEQDVYQTIARQPTSTQVKATISYKSKSSPLSFGLGLGSTVDKTGDQTRRAELAIGYSSGTTAFEIVQTLSTLDSDWSTGAFAKWQGSSMYATGGGIYLNAMSAVQILARAGFILGAVDFGAFVTHIIKDQQNPFHGFSLRVAF